MPLQRLRQSVADVSLTYFEFTTLAILKLFADAKLDVVIMEVGLGGRLDAVNIIDPDVAIVTSVDLDHQQYLGRYAREDRFRKGGYFSAKAYGDLWRSVRHRSHWLSMPTRLVLIFGYSAVTSTTRVIVSNGAMAVVPCRRHALAYPSLRGANQLLNASAALAALEVLRDRLPLGAQEIRAGLVLVELPGRFQVLPGRPAVILDVAHNPHAAATLAQNLDQMGFFPYTYAVFGAMADKDVSGILSHLKDKIDHWYFCDLPLPRAASAESLASALSATGFVAGTDGGGERSIQCFRTPAEAYASARDSVGENDRIIVFGSFLTVAGVMAARQAH
jgi:dihydrofolate synthase / folylpolyglutamate synthase